MPSTETHGFLRSMSHQSNHRYGKKTQNPPKLIKMLKVGTYPEANAVIVISNNVYSFEETLPLTIMSSFSG